MLRENTWGGGGEWFQIFKIFEFRIKMQKLKLVKDFKQIAPT
jgi:hypothetical protein